MTDYRLVALRKGLHRSLGATDLFIKFKAFDLPYDIKSYNESSIPSADNPRCFPCTCERIRNSYGDTAKIGTQNLPHTTRISPASLASELHLDSLPQNDQSGVTTPSQTFPALSLAALREGMRSFRTSRSTFYERLASMSNSIHCTKPYAQICGLWCDRSYFSRLWSIVIETVGCEDLLVANALCLTLEKLNALVKLEEITLRAALKMDETCGTLYLHSVLCF